jgi:hypothetical protein
MRAGQALAFAAGDYAELVALAVSRRGGIICEMLCWAGLLCDCALAISGSAIGVAAWFAWPANLNWRTKRQTARGHKRWVAVPRRVSCQRPWLRWLLRSL